jgi:hypothetical protein
MLDGGFIQNSKLLIQNFPARAECAFPTDHFLTGFTKLTGWGVWIMDFECWIVDLKGAQRWSLGPLLFYA